ncbi:putative GMC oxidoreductase [Annulohypoxylon maeteangense]|uniref:putative GMC oxidoreductase n=1 Tax=Annulohypoxylon maeteangense TaxID=1927788 RepID=UPI002008C8D2|nr:putative GMC oxidoreductase [Annulohypoxylon maeteangense]KAI0888532.1 putative GMC oxidoreductase [Annulohypoxylon maeteangense]
MAAVETSSTANLSAEYDYVVVGGGTSGLVIASRLTENKDVRVLVLEAGANRVGDPKISIQGLAAALYFDPDYDWCITTEPQVGLNDRRLAQPLGKTLGGSSAINLGMVIYPSRSGFDTWDKLGNPGWGWETMESYFRKFHTFSEPQSKLKKELMLDYLNAAQGTDGPIHISYGSEEGYPPFAQAWPRAWSALCKPIDGDPISGTATGAFNNAATIHPTTRERSHAGNTYFSDSTARRPNLRVVTEAFVEKILLSQRNDGINKLRATGVTFSTKNGQRRQVTATREVILAAGAVKSPQLLELSGIGNKSVLAKYKIDCLVDNSNIGENLQDHGFVPFSWEVADPMTSGDQMRNPSVVEAAIEAYQQAKAGPLSVNALASAFFPLQDQDLVPVSVDQLLSELGQTEVEPKALREQICTPGDCSAQFTLAPFQLNPFPGDSPSQIFGLGADGFYASIVAVLNHPFSRGSVHIQSADPRSSPIVDPRAMSNPLDLELHARHVLLLEKIRDTSPLRELFKEGGRRLHNDGQRVETLSQAKEAVKNGYTPHYHVCGTAAMLPRESGGVVDSKLRVYGVDGLRIVDASVFPLIPRGNIQSSVYAVAERAADIIKSGE